MEDTNSTTPVVQIPQNNWLLILLVGILILVIGIAAGFLVGKYVYSPKIVQMPIPIVAASPTPVSITDPTANWKIYRDQKYEFKYQDYWKSEASADGSKQLLSLKSPTEMNMSLSLIENLSGLGLECEVETDQQQITINQSTVTKIYTSGVKDDSCGDNSGSRAIWASLSKNGGDYLIIRYGAATTQLAESAFDQILSTFKFVFLGYDLQRRTDVNAVIRPGLELYKFDHKQYPDSLNLLVPAYLITLPVDPITKESYPYKVSVNKSDYNITVAMEDGTVLVVESPK